MSDLDSTLKLFKEFLSNLPSETDWQAFGKKAHFLIREEKIKRSTANVAYGVGGFYEQN